MKSKQAVSCQGVCPVCGSRDLDYGRDYPESEEIYYEWQCPDCGSEGKEWYSLAFIEHTVSRERRGGKGRGKGE